VLWPKILHQTEGFKASIKFTKDRPMLLSCYGNKNLGILSQNLLYGGLYNYGSYGRESKAHIPNDYSSTRYTYTYQAVSKSEVNGMLSRFMDVSPF